MGSLIKNEIVKILRKKAIYIMLIVILAFTILTNVLYKYTSSQNNIYFNEIYIDMLKEEMKILNPNNPEDIDIYISNKTEIETHNLMKEFDANSWQFEIIESNGREYISEINYYTYKDKNEEELEHAKSKYNNFVEILKAGDWRKFAEEELKQQKEQKELIGKDLITEIQIEALQMRLDYNIEYGNNYKNRALDMYTQSKIAVSEYEERNNNTFLERTEYQNSKANLEKSKYAIENDKDIFNENNSRGILLNLFSEYELFIMITIVLIAGSIVSEEFNKGTIKLLLVRPYSRIKILIAKYLVVLITIVFIIVAIGIMQFIVGNIFFGTDSLKIPAVEYNHTSGKIMEMSIFKNMLNTAIGKLPIYILLGTLAFSLSTLFTNTAVAISITLLGYMTSNIINQFAYYLDIKWIKYFVTPNWDFTQYLYGSLPKMDGINILFSVITCLVYFLIMVIPTIIIFKKKNIKNV